VVTLSLGAYKCIEMYNVQLTMKLEHMQKKINSLENEIAQLKNIHTTAAQGWLSHNSPSFDIKFVSSERMSTNDSQNKTATRVDDSMNDLSFASKKYMEQNGLLNK
jgi:hypothetical protein